MASRRSYMQKKSLNTSTIYTRVPKEIYRFLSAEALRDERLLSTVVRKYLEAGVRPAMKERAAL